MKKVLIIDGDNGLHRAYHKYGGFTNSQGKPSSLIFGFPYMVRSMITKNKPDLVYITFDGGSSKERLKLIPTYKQRDKKLGFDYENFIAQKEVIKSLMMDLGIRVAWAKGQEADDIIYSLVRRHRKDRVCIVSGDKDFHQLITDKVTIFSPHREIELTEKNLVRYFPYTPSETVDFLCLTGDKSDNIPGYGGIGEVKARAFLDKHLSIKNFLQTYSLNMGKTLDPIKLNKVYKVNRVMIDLGYFYRKFNRKNPIPILNPTPLLKLHSVAAVANEYEVTTLLKVDFLSVFKNLFDNGKK